MAIKPVSVSQLNNYISRILKTDPILNNIGVSGEISNLKYHSSGHVYFVLKDSDSKINCFLPYDRASALHFILADGMQVCCYGAVTVYEKGGYYSLNVKTVDAEGEGTLKKAFDLLKEKLQKEGLFDQAHKKAIPSFPKKVGVITSSTGAAVKDIITTIKRRNPFIDILIYPCLVQGDESASDIAKSISEFNRLFPDTDVLIVGRGGGSSEDLWSFNEEIVAKAIYSSEIPVISAVGHEQDYVISDLAADLRGATPTAAAELVSPDIGFYRDRLNRCDPALLINSIKAYCADLQFKTETAYSNVKRAYEFMISELEHRISLLNLSVNSDNPSNILKKGYGIVRKDNKIVIKAASLSSGDHIEIVFNDGNANCRVESTELKNDRKH